MSGPPQQPAVLLYMAQEDELVALAARLGSCGFAVVPTGSLDEIERALQAQRVDLAFVEVRGGSPDGLAVIRACKARHANLPVLVLSSNKDLACRTEARSAGAGDYLATPVRNIDLEMRVAQLKQWLGPHAAPRGEPTRDTQALLDENARLRTELQEVRKQRASAVHRMEEAESRTDQALTQARSLVEAAKTRSSKTEQAPSPVAQDDVDSVTGLPGAGALQDHLDREYARSRRYGHVLTVLMLGLDRLGRYNKQHGQDAGDRALRLLADVLRSALRSPDIVTRHAGDNFVVLATDTDQEQGVLLGNRLRAALRVESRHASLPVLTVSIGVACSKRVEVSRAVDLLGAAERSLALAKSEGRDCCHADAS